MKKIGEEKHPVLCLIIAFVLAVTSIIIFIYNARGEDNIPGPDFHDNSWQEGPSEENWLNTNLTLVHYFKRDSNSGTTQMGIEIYYNSEIVMQAWGMVFRKDEFDKTNTHYAIKQEDGSWKIGNMGEKWWEIINEDEDNDNKVWFFVKTKSGLKEGRGFSKIDLGDSLKKEE